MATVQITIPDSLVGQLEAEAQRQGFPNLQAFLKATLRTLLLRQRLQQAEAGVVAQLEQELA